MSDYEQRQVEAPPNGDDGTAAEVEQAVAEPAAEPAGAARRAGAGLPREAPDPEPRSRSAEARGKTTRSQPGQKPSRQT